MSVPRLALRHIWAADAARDVDEWEGAARAYAKALASAPQLSHVWVQYGHMLREAGRREEARDAYERAVTLEPLVREPYELLIRLARAAGDREGILRHSLTIFRLDRSDTQAQIMLLQSLSAGEPHHDGPIAEIADAIGLAPRPEAATVSRVTTLHIDVGDLITHFTQSRLPSGLQRVEIEVTRSALAEAVSIPSLCCWSMAAAAWKPLAGDAFLALVDAAASSVDDACWHHQLSSVLYSLVMAPALTFPPGSTLLNLGMAWGDPTYHPAVAREKARSGLRFAAIACDVIPLVRPDEVPQDIVSACADWLDALSEDADMVIAISSATRDQIMKVSAARGRPIGSERIEVVPLDAMFSPVRSGETDILVRYGLKEGGYALYVSTVEPRKNHLAAFQAWRILAADDGSMVPDLVCVGRMGWRSEAVAAVLATDRELARRVHMLVGISDDELSDLYARCAFVFYPSLQEGWGLPVTEALAYGKVPVIGRNSSLPEAGGSLALYFDASSPADMAAVIASLIRDPAARASRETAIRDTFRPRGWHAVAKNMMAVAVGLQFDA